MMNPGYRRLAVIVCVMALSALAGCREEEQGRPLNYSKGIYQGQPDEALRDETLDALRQRAQRQNYN